ncbi:MAG: hypothetical protein GQ531_02635 [Sulfurovum sp.]|nr:hypothetical protein [Sulfurovum sp.]
MGKMPTLHRSLNEYVIFFLL